MPRVAPQKKQNETSKKRDTGKMFKIKILSKSKVVVHNKMYQILSFYDMKTKGLELC